MRTSLSNSLNIPAVKTLSLVGVPEALKTSKDLGITSLNEPDRYGLALVLGGGEVKPLEMAGAFAAFSDAGTYHKPPVLTENKYEIHEATAAANYLIDNGVNSKHLLREQISYDTIGCVYFCLLLFIIPRDWSNICVITSDFHMPRTKELFLWIFNLYKQNNYKFTFLKTDNSNNVPPDILAPRIKREQQSLINLKENVIGKIKTMKELNEWLYTEHKAYSCMYLKHREDIDDDMKKSY